MNRASIIRRERIEECLRHAPTAVAGGVANALLASVVMWSSGKHLEILVWMCAIFLCGAFRVGLYRSSLRSPQGKSPGQREERRIELISLLNGVIWGSGIALAGMVATPGQFYTIAALSGGMMGAAVLTYGSMARAALMGTSNNGDFVLKWAA